MNTNTNPQAQAAQAAPAPSAQDNTPATAPAQGTAAPATLQGQTQTQAQPTAGDGHPGEKLYAGKYKTPEDLEKGYMELRKLLGAKGVLGVFDQPKTEGQQAQQQLGQQAQQQIDWSAVNESFRQNFEQNPIGTLQMLLQAQVTPLLAPLQERLTSQAIQAEALRLAAQYQDFDVLSERIANLLKGKPHLQQLVKTNPSALEDVYLMAKAELAAEVAQAAKDAGRQEGQQTLQNKAASATVPASARQTPQQKTPEQEIAERIFGVSGKTKGIFG